MAKQSSRVRNEITGEGRRVNREHGGLMDILMGRINDPTSSPGAGYRNQAASGYNAILGRGTSSYDPMFKEMARTGGLTDENRNRIRGAGNFDEFARTGGYSEGDLSNIRSRSSRTTPSFFEDLKNRFNTQNQITGASPSYGASMSRMARDQSRQASDVATDTELGIKEAVNRGRQWGTTGMSSAETGLAGLESANRRFGIGGGAANEVANRGIDLDALRGILGVGESASGDQFKLYDLLLNTMGQRGRLSGANVGQRAAYDPNVSWFDRLMRIWQMSQNSASPSSIQGQILG